MGHIALSKLLYRHLAGVHRDGDTAVILVGKGHILSEYRRGASYNPTDPGPTVCSLQGLEGPGAFLQKGQVADAIQPVVGRIVVLVGVADEIIFALLGRHLIGADDATNL